MSRDALDRLVWWQVYPLAASRGTGDDTHVTRLNALLPWLDYVTDLGCSGLLLGPIFASTSHGYDTLDHFRIDPRLGDEADFDRLIAEANARGLRVMLDGVFNHVSRDHELVRRAVADGYPSDGIIKATTAGDGAQRPASWEGHAELVELNHASRQTRDLVADIMLHWLRKGIAGWRLDVAYAVPPQSWNDIITRVHQEFPDTIFLGEVIHGDYAQIAEAGSLTSVTQYELWKAIRSSITDVNFWELAHALERHAKFSERVRMHTFVGNHDVTRIASAVGDNGAVLAAVILLTVPGMPGVYYGDEQAFHGVKGESFGADDELRPVLPPTANDLADDGWWLHRIYRDLIAIRRQHAWMATAALEVIDKTNEWIEYESRADGRRLHVRLDLGDHYQAQFRIDDDVVFAWSQA